MTAKRKKLVELNLDQKKEVLDWLDKGVTQRCLAEEFGVAKATIVNINKNRETILKSWEDGSHGERKRKMRKTENEPVNILVLEFLKKCRAMNIPVSGPMLQTMAKEVAQRLNLEEFQASNGWLASFKERNNVHFRNGVQKQQKQQLPFSMDMSAAENWKSKLEHLLKKYPPENRFNADETGLLYRKLPAKNMLLDMKHSHGGQLANEMLTILCCCSATGEKLKPLVIGNCARPAVFKKNNLQLEHLPVTWCFNRKAWMTCTIFETWLQYVNEKMKRDNRNIILLVDNATCHYGTKEMSNVTVKFLPTNLTQVQPMCQGIMREVRARYRNMMLQCLVTNAGKVKTLAEFSSMVTVLDAIRWINGAWREILTEKIVKCFKRAGFYYGVQWEEFKEVTTIGIEETIRALPVHIQHELASVNDIVEFDNMLTLHEEVQTSADAIADEVLGSFQGTYSNLRTASEEVDEDEGKDGEERQSSPSHEEALQHVAQLMKYAASHQPSLVEKLLNMYTSIEVHWATASINSTHDKLEG